MNVAVRVPSRSGSAWNSGDVDHREVGLEVRQDRRVLLADEHVAGEEVVPGVLGDDADVDAVAGIGAGVAVEDEDVLVLQVLLARSRQGVELLPLERPVDVAPPDVGVDRRIFDQELVVRRAPGVLARLADQGARRRPAPPRRAARPSRPAAPAAGSSTPCARPRSRVCPVQSCSLPARRFAFQSPQEWSIRGKIIDQEPRHRSGCPPAPRCRRRGRWACAGRPTSCPA